MGKARGGGTYSVVISGVVEGSGVVGGGVVGGGWVVGGGGGRVVGGACVESARHKDVYMWSVQNIKSSRRVNVECERHQDVYTWSVQDIKTCIRGVCKSKKRV